MAGLRELRDHPGLSAESHGRCRDVLHTDPFANYFLEVRRKINIKFTEFLDKSSTSPILVLIKHASSFKGLKF